MEAAEALKDSIARTMPRTLTRIACLKKFQLSAAQAAGELAAAGAARIMVVPMFIAPGGHVARDFPQLARELSTRWPDIEFSWTDVAGVWEEVISAMVAGIQSRLGMERGGENKREDLGQ